MSPTRLLLFSALGLGGLLVFAGTAKAAAPEPEPVPPPPENPAMPEDNMPWMRYSATTLARQGDYNDWASANGWPTIKEDGILGPNTCKALTDWWFNGGGPAVPQVCGDLALQQVCKDAATYKAEYDRLEAMYQAGDPFYEKEQQDAVYVQWQRAAARCNQGV